MYLSTLRTCRVPAVALALILWGFGAMSLQAQDNHNNHGCGCAPPPKVCPSACPAPQPKPCPSACPAPQLQKPGPPSHVCCKLPEVRQPCGNPCCPIDPKQVSRAQRAVDHAQHEAAEACQRQQRAVARAQSDQERAYERGQARINRANAHLNHEVAEFTEAASRLEGLGGPTEPVAEATTQPEN